MPDRTKLVISNHWHRPGIAVTIFHDEQTAPQGGIRLEMPLADFIEGVIAEMPHAITMQSRGALATKLRQAVTAALEKAKQASSVAVAAAHRE